MQDVVKNHTPGHLVDSVDSRHLLWPHSSVRPEAPARAQVRIAAESLERGTDLRQNPGAVRVLTPQ